MREFLLGRGSRQVFRDDRRFERPVVFEIFEGL